MKNTFKFMLIMWGGLLVSSRLVLAEDSSGETKYSFRNDILPILSRAGCAAGACHAKAEGQNGFQLSIFAYDPESDHREIVHNARGRRIFPAAPEHSLLLLKATNEIPHEGGEKIAKDSAQYEAVIAWIRQGAPYTLPDDPADLLARNADLYAVRVCHRIRLPT